MSLLSSWLSSPPPDAAIEIAPDRIAAMTLRGRASGAAIESYASEPLPPGAVVASLTSRNIVDPLAVADALRRTLAGLRARPARVALVLPDSVAKVSLVHFDTVPAQHNDLDQLIRWQVRKAAPFAIEEASVTYTRGASSDDGVEFLVAVARRDVIEQYEAVCESVDVEAGLIDLATFSVINLCLSSAAAPTGDWLLVHVGAEYASLAIMRGEHVILFRSRVDSDELLDDLVHQTAMYYQDRLSGAGFSRVLLAATDGTQEEVEAIRRGLEERLGVVVEAIDAMDALAGTNLNPGGTGRAAALAPLLGILVRSQGELVSA